MKKTSEIPLQGALSLVLFLAAATLSSGGALTSRVPVYILAGLALFNPRHTLTVALACAALLVAFVSKHHLTNHDTVIVTVLLTILCSYAFAAWSARGLRVQSRTFHECLAPVMRLEFIVFYGWVGLHKLNTDFFDPDRSCATELLAKTAEEIPLLAAPAWAEPMIGYLTVGTELGALALILIPRTRWFGILLAALFHTLLGILYPAFQLLTMSFLVLFIPQTLLADARRQLHDAFARLPRLSKFAFFLAHPTWRRALLGIALLVTLRVTLFEPLTRTPARIVVLLGLVVSYVALLIFTKPRKPPTPERLWTGAPVVLLVFPLFMFFQGLQPHLGIKAVQSFAMFSNLDTQNGQSNHLFVPAALQVSDNLSDTVVLHRTNMPLLRRMKRHAEGSLAVSHAGLRQAVSRASRAGRRHLFVDYTHDGVRRVVTQAEHDPQLSEANAIERYYLKHRPIATGDHGTCRW